MGLENGGAMLLEELVYSLVARCGQSRLRVMEDGRRGSCSVFEAFGGFCNACLSVCEYLSESFCVFFSVLAMSFAGVGSGFVYDLLQLLNGVLVLWWGVLISLAVGVVHLLALLLLLCYPFEELLGVLVGVLFLGLGKLELAAHVVACSFAVAYELACDARIHVFLR